MREQTLIVSATYDDSHPDWFERLPEPKARISTFDGGHPSQALIRAFRFDRQRHDSYLLLQDTLEPLVEDVVTPFREKSKGNTIPVAWARFPLFFDTPEQKDRVEKQYPHMAPPEHGIFGPIFYVPRKVLERLDRFHRLPKTPESKMDAQGTERAWAYAFALLGITPAHLHDWSNEHVASGDALPFRKVFAGRQ